MKFPHLPAMWPGLPEPPKIRPICKGKCKMPTDLQYLVDGVCGPCRIENMKHPPGIGGYWPATAGTDSTSWPSTGTATDTGTGSATRYYTTKTTASGTGKY